MIHRLSHQTSLASEYLLQMRDEHLQLNPTLFRRNLHRFGQIMAYEISKHLNYASLEVNTSLGVADCKSLNDTIVLATIIRAGLPMHDGMLSFFDDAENAFISAFRHHHKDGTFEVSIEYISSPELDDKVLIICDPMLATGSSMVRTIKALLDYGRPRSIHIASIIASTAGLEYVALEFPDATIWIGEEDEELTGRSYIVPGLGDAGDLAYGKKPNDEE
ncbi:MAG: uracil phosphoribosyltransferase [Bacteroidota bacterium]|nr:uracil phosphoribosyltransferase [Bacteroidota bacterium]